MILITAVGEAAASLYLTWSTSKRLVSTAVVTSRWAQPLMVPIQRYCSCGFSWDVAGGSTRTPRPSYLILEGLRDQRERGPGEGKGGAATAKKATRGYHTTDLKEAVT